MANVLIVEDDVGIAKHWEEDFNRAGHNSKAVFNGQQGLEALADFNPDIIFTDFNMPVMDGGVFARTIRENPDYATYSQLPIVSVGAFPPVLRSLLTEYHNKPVDFDTLNECVLKYCK